MGTVKNTKEAERVESLGGKLWKGRVCHPAIAPESGSIAVSRTIGDVLFRDSSFTVKRVCDLFCCMLTIQQTQNGKPVALSSEPHVVEQDVTSDDLFVVLACDGVWDVLTHRAACVIVLEALLSHNNPQRAAETLAAEALAKGSTDNVTVAVMGLRERLPCE